MHIVPRLRVLLIVLVLALLGAACGGDATDETARSPETTPGAADLDLVTPGQLTVCSDIPYPPFEFEEGGEFTGFDIELMRAIAGRLGLELEVRRVSFEALQSGAELNARKCDVAASAMTIKPDREQNLDFSEPYYEAQQSLLTTTDSPIRTLADTAGRTLGVQSATTGAEYAEEHAPEEATIRRFGNAGDLFTALQAGRIDAILQDLPVNAEYAREHEEAEVVETYDTGERYGFAVREEGSESLLEGINDALEELRDDGTYEELYERYFAAG